MTLVVDLCAGPGGWDHAAQQLGMDPIGIELDPDTCATREAAGLQTIHGDISSVRITDDIDGLIGSPPCPIFSSLAGKSGLGEIDAMITAINSGNLNPDGLSADANLCLEPARWIERHGPSWVALEQVPAVLPIWQALASSLAAQGWSAWAGILNAANYGVPQTRKRAFLIASNVRHVHPPLATHAEFPEPSLFDQGGDTWRTVSDALGYDCLINTGQDWRGDTRETAQTIDGRFRPAPTLTANSGGQWHLCPVGPQSDVKACPMLEVWEGSVLQSFPRDYPWQGLKTSVWRQVGNAVPPLLAGCVLGAASGAAAMNLEEAA